MTVPREARGAPVPRSTDCRRCRRGNTSGGRSESPPVFVHAGGLILRGALLCGLAGDPALGAVVGPNDNVSFCGMDVRTRRVDNPVFRDPRQEFRQQDLLPEFPRERRRPARERRHRLQPERLHRMSAERGEHLIDRPERRLAGLIPPERPAVNCGVLERFQLFHVQLSGDFGPNSRAVVRPCDGRKFRIHQPSNGIDLRDAGEHRPIQ